MADPTTAGTLAARLGKALAVPFSIKGHKVRITSSIGIALYSPDVAGPEAMMMQADLALYGAKDEGRNCYRFHSQDLDLQVHERVRVADELRVAIEQGELELYYQPQVELSTGRIVGLEALVRWNHKTRGLLTPGYFIPIAERTGVVTRAVSSSSGMPRGSRHRRSRSMSRACSSRAPQSSSGRSKQA